MTVPPIHLSQVPSIEPLRILILADLHIPLGNEQKRMILANRHFLDEHDWVVLLGDVTALYGTPGEYRRAGEFVRRLGRPYSVTTGNHEFSFVPPLDDTPEYGRQWDYSSPEIQQSQLQRFERFFGLDSRFQAYRHPLAGLCLFGVDEIGEGAGGFLSPEHEAWLETVLDEMAGAPLLIFCHFPVFTQHLKALLYYDETRRPYYEPPQGIRARLAARTWPTFWFSGHLHLRPSHPFFRPYQTDDEVWQVHCPDSWGFGRPDNEDWLPEFYDGLFARSLVLEQNRLSIITTDVARGSEVARDCFDLR